MAEKTNTSTIKGAPSVQSGGATRHRAVPFEKSERVSASDGHGRESSDCGDLIEFFVQLKDDTVAEVHCHVAGCTNVFVSARAAGTLVKNKSLREAIAVTTAQNIDDIAALPEQNRHCADMAADAMKKALFDAATSAREPWRRLYRKI